MITFNGLDLFSSGPGLVDPGPVQSRDAVAEAPGGVGAAVIGQGLAPRTIDQHGTLIADSQPALQGLIDAIARHVGSQAATLVDQHGHAFACCVMQRMKTGTIDRLGPRFACAYTLRYLQACP